jgi:predicted transcriptional regulator
MTTAPRTSIRLPEDIHELYETLARATGRAKDEIMVEVLRAEGRRLAGEIATILIGREQARAGQLSPIEDVVARFTAKGMLPVGFDLEAGHDGAPSGV